MLTQNRQIQKRPDTAASRVRRIAVARGARPGQDRIEVRTDDGLVGAGEGSWCEGTLRRAPEMVLGRSPFEVEAIFDDLALEDGAAPGGLDMALWDLAGKALGVPAATLLGRRHRTEAEVCAAVMGGQAPEGFRMWRVEPARAGEVEGGFGCGVRLTAGDVAQALETGAILEARPLAFWQTPLDERDADGYRALREKLAVPVAARGEAGFDSLLTTLLQQRLVDIVIPDIGAFGLTGIRRLAYYCWLFRVRGAVECSGSPVSRAAAMAAAGLYVPVTNAIAAPAPFVVMPASMCRERVLRAEDGAGLGVGSPPLESPDVVLEER